MLLLAQNVTTALQSFVIYDVMRMRIRERKLLGLLTKLFPQQRNKLPAYIQCAVPTDGASPRGCEL
jgi:hypothetical protein